MEEGGASGGKRKKKRREEEDDEEDYDVDLEEKEGESPVLTAFNRFPYPIVTLIVFFLLGFFLDYTKPKYKTRYF